MKNKIFFTLVVLFITASVMAQPGGGPGGPPCWPPEDCVPIDGLSTLLLAGGALYVGKNRKKFFNQ